MRVITALALLVLMSGAALACPAMNSASKDRTVADQNGAQQTKWKQQGNS